MGKCVIVGAGECNIDDMKRELVIGSDDICIAADGGLDFLLEAGLHPDFVIGDMDSVDNRTDMGNYEVEVFPTQKDDTDMMLAIKEGLKRGYGEFEIYGALGGRLDHTFANVQCLGYLVNNGAKGRLIGSGGSFVTMIKNGDIVFKGGKYESGRKISVFAYGSMACGVTERGLKYNLDNITMKTDFPLGVSNEFTGEDAYIKVSDGILMICVD
jgi:thiamine pyrophosphokinase